MEKYINRIFSLLERIIYGPATKMRSASFSNNQNFDFKKLSDGLGVRNFTIQNIGKYQLIIVDENQVIRPGESFTIIGNTRVINQKVEFKFGDIDPDADVGDNTVANKLAIARYLVDVKE